MNSLTPVGRSYPACSKIDYWAAPDGWPLRRFAWPAKERERRGTMLFLTGRGDMFEKYLESFAHFHDLGWDIISFDWRGQGGSGRLSANPQVGHCEDFNVWVDDLHAFYRQWIDGEPGPHIVIGHSMGGHLLSRVLSARMIRPDAAVMIAPMLGLNSGILPARLAGPVARLMSALGDPARAAWKNVERPGIGPSLRQALLTHSAERYSDEMYWQEHMPQLKLGPPSWQWLNAAYRSLAMLDSPGTLEKIETPLLILAAERDGLVDTQAIRRAANRIGGARLHVHGPEAAHEILREADAVRSDALQRIDAFLDDVAPRQ